MNAIEVENLYYSYKNDEKSSLPILKGLNLCINEGELVAIQGPSGSGKSTLLYLLGLLSAADSGRLKILNKDIASLNQDELAHHRNQNIGFIFQQFHLLPKTTALQNILLPTTYLPPSTDSQVFEKKARQLAEYVGLSERLMHMPNQLSGGQQQRVAICRALINDPKIILADEPTGNLDSESATQILKLLKDLNRDFKKTIIIITHDNEVAKNCDRIIHIKDGRLDQNQKNILNFDPTNLNSDLVVTDQKPELKKIDWAFLKNALKNNLPLALKNLSRNKTRTALTMIGISVGVAAVLAMITLGQFTKNKILAGYAELGVNSVVFYGYPNWEQKATDIVPVSFRFFNWDNEIIPLKKIFPEIERMTPVLSSWEGGADFGGKSIDQDVRLIGVSEDSLLISKRKILSGRNFSTVEIEQKSGVCIIGYEIAERLFTNSNPLGQTISVNSGSNSFGCSVIGILSKTTSNKEYVKPNLQIYLPFTFYQAIAGDWWSSQIRQVIIQVNPNSDIEVTGQKIKTFFEQRYGKSGRFRVDSDTVLLAQMKKFLGLFTILLSSIAFITLSVGGISITNMMLVSVSERFREIGLRKALGATQTQIRIQFLLESMIICAIAGFIGLIVGFGTYHLAIWGTSKFVDKIKFEWIIDGVALTISLISIVVVGVLSGIFPALKAEKLQVIEALRSE